MNMNTRELNSTKWDRTHVNEALVHDCRLAWLNREQQPQPKIAKGVRTYHWWMDFAKTIKNEPLKLTA